MVFIDIKFLWFCCFNLCKLALCWISYPAVFFGLLRKKKRFEWDGKVRSRLSRAKRTNICLLLNLRFNDSHQSIWSTEKLMASIMWNKENRDEYNIFSPTFFKDLLVDEKWNPIFLFTKYKKNCTIKSWNAHLKIQSSPLQQTLHCISVSFSYSKLYLPYLRLQSNYVIHKILYRAYAIKVPRNNPRTSNHKNILNSQEWIAAQLVKSQDFKPVPSKTWSSARKRLVRFLQVGLLPKIAITSVAPSPIWGTVRLFWARARTFRWICIRLLCETSTGTSLSPQGMLVPGLMEIRLQREWEKKKKGKKDTTIHHTLPEKCKLKSSWYTWLQLKREKIPFGLLLISFRALPSHEIGAFAKYHDTAWHSRIQALAPSPRVEASLHGAYCTSVEEPYNKNHRFTKHLREWNNFIEDDRVEDYTNHKKY